MGEYTNIRCPDEPANSHPPIPKTYGSRSRFNVSDDMLHRMGLPPNQFVPLDEMTINQFVFVTGVSENHFNELKDAIGSVQAHFPGRKIYYYDIGLNEEQKKQVWRLFSILYVTGMNKIRN